MGGPWHLVQRIPEEKLVQAGCTEGDEDENETVELMAARLLKAHKEDVWGANRAGADGVVLGA